MKISTQDYNEVTVVELNGEFVADFVDLFERKMSDLITSNRHDIVIDMSSVAFIDSQGLEKLLWLRDYCAANMCQLKLAGLDENCTQVLHITRIEDMFDKYVELSEAVKSFA